jgi:hypothetical protein
MNLLISRYFLRNENFSPEWYLRVQIIIRRYSSRQKRLPTKGAQNFVQTRQSLASESRARRQFAVNSSVILTTHYDRWAYKSNYVSAHPRPPASLFGFCTTEVHFKKQACTFVPDHYEFKTVKQRKSTACTQMLQSYGYSLHRNNHPLNIFTISILHAWLQNLS